MTVPYSLNHTCVKQTHAICKSCDAGPPTALRLYSYHQQAKLRARDGCDNKAVTTLRYEHKTPDVWHQRKKQGQVDRKAEKQHRNNASSVVCF
jgi:hypothetical protein